jgi:hypothetical protein
MFRWEIEHEQIVGTYNATGSHPVPNATFMRELRRVLRVPLGLPAPAFIVRMGAFVMRTEASALTGRQCVPARFTEQDFAFMYPNLGETLRDLLG